MTGACGVTAECEVILGQLKPLGHGLIKPYKRLAPSKPSIAIQAKCWARVLRNKRRNIFTTHRHYVVNDPGKKHITNMPASILRRYKNILDCCLP